MSAAEPSAEGARVAQPTCGACAVSIMPLCAACIPSAPPAEAVASATLDAHDGAEGARTVRERLLAVECATCGKRRSEHQQGYSAGRCYFTAPRPEARDAAARSDEAGPHWYSDEALVTEFRNAVGGGGSLADANVLQGWLLARLASRRAEGDTALLDAIERGGWSVFPYETQQGTLWGVDYSDTERDVHQITLRLALRVALESENGRPPAPTTPQEAPSAEGVRFVLGEQVHECRSGVWFLLTGMGAMPCGEFVSECLTRIAAAEQRADALERERDEAMTLRPESEWHEDVGPVLWWSLPIGEPPYSGTPLDSDWPGYHTHWTRIPSIRAARAGEGGAR